MSKKEHRHDWRQVAVTMVQGKGGRATGVTVRWECAGRKCGASTVTELAIRKPAPSAKPKGPNAGWTAGEVQAAVRRTKAERRARGESLAAMADEDDRDAFDEEELTAAEFERSGPDGNGRRPRTVEETRQALGLYAPLTLREV